MALTKSECDRAAARERDYVLWDNRVKGFGLKVTRRGHKAFVLLYRAGRGRQAPLRKITIGTCGSPWTVDQARIEAKRLLGEVAHDRDPAADKAEKRRAQRAGEAVEGSVRAAVEEWLRRDNPNKRTADEVRRIMERDVIPFWGDRPLGGIRKRDVIELVDRVSDRASSVRANRVLAWTKRWLNWCCSRDLIEASPAAHVMKPGEERHRERVLEDEELVELWHALDRLGGAWAAGVKVLLLTGARLAEIFEARRSELDATGTRLRLPAERSKSGEGRTIHLSERAAAIVADLPRFNSGWLISITGRAPLTNHGRDKARLDAAILEVSGGDPMPPWRLHDLRRTAATGMQRLGVRLEVIETVLGHVSGSRQGIVGVYQRHRFEDEARAALEAWARHVEGLITGRKAKVVRLVR